MFCLCWYVSSLLQRHAPPPSSPICPSPSDWLLPHPVHLFGLTWFIWYYYYYYDFSRVLLTLNTDNTNSDFDVQWYVQPPSLTTSLLFACLFFGFVVVFCWRIDSFHLQLLDSCWCWLTKLQLFKELADILENVLSLRHLLISHLWFYISSDLTNHWLSGWVLRFTNHLFCTNQEEHLDDHLPPLNTNKRCLNQTRNPSTLHRRWFQSNFEWLTF